MVRILKRVVSDSCCPIVQRSYAVQWCPLSFRRYENEHALTRDEVELYGLWLESHSRYDEALGLYNLHEAHLPNERLLAALAALRDPTMMITTQDTQSLLPVRRCLAVSRRTPVAMQPVPNRFVLFEQRLISYVVCYAVRAT